LPDGQATGATLLLAHMLPAGHFVHALYTQFKIR